MERGERPSFLIGLDLGQAADYSALVVAERTTRLTGRTVETPVWDGRRRGGVALRSLSEVEGVYSVRALERFSLGTSYVAVVQRVEAIMRILDGPGVARRASFGLPLNAPSKRLVVDATGVGAAVIDQFRAAGLHPVAVTITGGDAVSGADPSWRVPKRDLVSTLQVLMQTGRLKVAAGLPLAGVLQSELGTFRVAISAKGHDSYAAWRERDHDDLVLALALACWCGEHGSGEVSLVPWGSEGAGRLPHRPTGGDRPRGLRR